MQASDDVRRRVADKVERDGTIDVYAALALETAAEKVRILARNKARQRREEARQRITGAVEFELVKAAFGDGEVPPVSTADPPTFRQIELMRSLGIAIPAGVTKSGADALITNVQRLRNQPSDKQTAFLRSQGITRDVTRKEASALISQFMARKKRRAYG